MGDRDYLEVLKAVQDIPFPVGKKLLIAFLQGKTIESIERNRLHKKASFGALSGYSEEELHDLVEGLLTNHVLGWESLNGNKFWKVLCLTEKGVHELSNPGLYKRKLSFRLKQTQTVITEQEKEQFKQFESIAPYADEQKKAVTSPAARLLCIAGAGSGKTTALTQRIAFLVRYKSVVPEKILAITFTRKARQEMMKRVNIPGVHIETFHSFCEKILNQHAQLQYGKYVRMISTGEKIRLLKEALTTLHLSPDQALKKYFSSQQINGKTPDQLLFTFMHDCFFILDYYKSQNKEVEDFSKKAFPYDNTLLTTAFNAPKMVYVICKHLEKRMKALGLRDHMDQLMDCLALFRQHPHLIPQFDHVLVDEYQDINAPQHELIKLLHSKNIFAVGDPRQSIFGWRGSRVDYLLDLEHSYPESELIFLTQNYRSSPQIVSLFNKAIAGMKLPEVSATKTEPATVKMLGFPDEHQEREFITHMILASPAPRNEIFVLARTNNQLTALSHILKSRNIPHVVRTDELRKPVTPTKQDVILSTVHAIKGMEAEVVFVMGCTNQHFPCKASDHPVVDMVKLEAYDKEEEEKRLFYVALSRAKQQLFLTYTGSLSRFVTEEMKSLVEEVDLGRKKEQSSLVKEGETREKTGGERGEQKEIKEKNHALHAPAQDLVFRLKQWRKEHSTQQNIPPYIIMHDATLLEIASRKPSSPEELEQIYGMGPVKVKKYGEAILAMLS